MKKVLALRGLPGSGKNYYIENVIEKEFDFLEYRIVSADGYFIRPDGIYDWNPRLLWNAHQYCFINFEEAIEKGTPLIILNNTNIKKSYYQHYIELAKVFDYEIEEIVIGEFTEEAAQLYASRNVHNVPYSTIKKMMEEFEK
jgi:predicted kinase